MEQGENSVQLTYPIKDFSQITIIGNYSERAGNAILGNPKGDHYEARDNEPRASSHNPPHPQVNRKDLTMIFSLSWSELFTPAKCDRSLERMSQNAKCENDKHILNEMKSHLGFGFYRVFVLQAG